MLGTNEGTSLLRVEIMKLIPSNGKLIVEEIADVQSSIIHVVRTETSDTKFVRGRVIEASKGFYGLMGQWFDSTVKKGDIIWYNRFNGAEMKVNRQNIILLDEKEVLLIEGED